MQSSIQAQEQQGKVFMLVFQIQRNKAMVFLFCVYRNRRWNQCIAAQKIKYKLLFLFFYLTPTQFLSYSGTNKPTEMADHFS